MLKITLHKILCLLLVIVSSFNAKLGAQNFKKIPFSVFETSDTMSIKDVINADHLFKEASAYNTSSPSKTYWIRLDFHEEYANLDKNNTWFLRFRNFDFGTLFYQEEDHLKSYAFGEFDVYDKNNLKIQSKRWFFPFKKDDLIKNRYIYLKIKRVRSFDAIKNWQFRYTATAQKNLVGNYYSNGDLRNLIPVFIFTGICFIMFFITLVSFFSLKKMEFLFYALYILALFLYLCGYTFNLQSIFGSHRVMGYWFFQIMQVLINLCYVIFVIYYLNTQKNYSKLHRVLILISIVLGLIVISDTLFFYVGYYAGHIHIMNFQRLIMSIFGFAGMIYLIFKAKNRLAYFVVSGSFLYTMGALGLLFLNNRNYMIGGSTLEITIFGLGLIYKIQQGHIEKLHFERESYINIKKALRAQINPHFIFNSLSSIQHLVTKNDRISAIKYLSKFSSLTRSILESSITSNALLSEEIKMLHNYLELEALRFDNEFEYTIVVNDNIDTNAIEIPSMLLQPFIENAIIHGLLPKPNGSKTVSINFEKNGQMLVCEIDDNGIGREASGKKTHIHKRGRKSRGLEVTRQRLNTLNDSEDNIEITDKTDNSGNASGTKVIIRIPI
ncbi:hypothetical protein GTQ40_03200 [Flavobacteriaceae bacterium R38]|nr:hypothetical protein [Flavobacteriaceae bacterium R38]